MSLKRIGTFTKKKLKIKDQKSDKEYDYCVIRFKWDDVPGGDDAILDAWSDTEHGYILLELAKTPKVKVGD